MNLHDHRHRKGESRLEVSERVVQLIVRIETPLRVSHCLVMEIWFAVQGEDEWGQPCEEYKTRVRTLTLRKAVMIPSVRIT